MTIDMPPVPPAVVEFYDNPKLVGEWRGYKVYAEDYGEDNPAIGLPQFVLYKNNKARLTTEDEAFAFIKEAPEKD